MNDGRVRNFRPLIYLNPDLKGPRGAAAPVGGGGLEDYHTGHVSAITRPRDSPISLMRILPLHRRLHICRPKQASLALISTVCTTSVST